MIMGATAERCAALSVGCAIETPENRIDLESRQNTSPAETLFGLRDGRIESSVDFFEVWL